MFYELAARNPDIQFLGVKGGYGEQMIEDLPNVTIQENTTIFGDDVYSRTKVLLMPSKYESFGRTAIEAAASGIPTIAHPTPGLIESLGDGGLFCDRTDVDLWDKTLKELMSDELVYDSHSQYALQRANQWDSIRPRELAEFVKATEEVAKKGV